MSEIVENTRMQLSTGTYRMERVNGSDFTRVYFTAADSTTEVAMGSIQPVDGRPRYWPSTNQPTAYGVESLVAIAGYMGDPDVGADDPTPYSYTLTRESAEVVRDDCERKPGEVDEPDTA